MSKDKVFTFTLPERGPLCYAEIEAEYRAEAGIPPEREVTEEDVYNFILDVLAWRFQREQIYRARDRIEAADAAEERRLRERVKEALDRGDYAAAEVLSGLHYAFDETEDDGNPIVTVKNGYPEEVDEDEDEDEDEEEVVYLDDPFAR